MRISAQVHNRKGEHEVLLTTNDQTHSLTISPKTSGFGSSANGGEILFLALATCYCNDIYREAEKRNIAILSVEVTVEGDFGLPGEPPRNVIYRARVAGQSSEDEIRSLMEETDKVAEIQNTLRSVTPVTLALIEPISLK